MRWRLTEPMSLLNQSEALSIDRVYLEKQIASLSHSSYVILCAHSHERTMYYTLSCLCVALRDSSNAHTTQRLWSRALHNVGSTATALAAHTISHCPMEVSCSSTRTFLWTWIRPHSFIEELSMMKPTTANKTFLCLFVLKLIFPDCLKLFWIMKNVT